jgi:hypothetical protein
MKEFALLFRQPDIDHSKISPKQMQELTKKWQDWAGVLEKQDRIASHGVRLAVEGKVLKPGGVITDGPFVEIRERLGGLVVVKAENLEDAVTIAHGCPVLETGGSVEIRPIFE